MGSLQPSAEMLAATEQQQVNVKALIQGVNAARRKCTEAQVDSSVLLLVRQARQLLELVSSADDNLMQLVVHSGVEAVLPLLTLADRTSLQMDDVSKYACAVLAAVAVKPEHKQLMAQALPGLFKLMQPHSRNTSGARWAADTVAALAQDSRAMQDMLREAGGIELLVQLLDAGDPRTQRSAVAALRAVCGQKNEANMRHLLKCDVLPKLVKLLGKEATVHNKALQLMGDLTHSGQQMRQAALQAGAMAPLMKLLSSSSKETQRAAALLVGQFAAPPLEEPVAAGLGSGQSAEGVIPALVRLLASQEPSVQEMAAFAVARLGQLSVNQAALIAAEGLPPLLGLLNSPVSTVQYNAAFALYELAACKEHLPVFHKAGGIQHLYVCSQRLRKGPTKACVDRTILCLEQHKAAASRGAAADAAASSDTAATAPEAEGITLAPLQLLAPSVDPEGVLRSPPALPAATLFGKAWPGTDDASGSAAVLAIPAQPLRLPTIDEIVAEAAAATAAEVAAEGSAAAQLLLLQQQQQQRALTPASLTELRQRAVAVELRLQTVQQQQQQQQQPVSGPLLKLAVARLCKQAGATAQAQQLAACALAQRHDLLQPDSAVAAASAASAAAGTLAAAAAAEAQAVSALFKVLMQQQGIPVSLLLQIRSSNGRWARAVRQLADAAEQHVQPDCQAGSNLAMCVATSAALLVLLAAAAVGAHQRHGLLDVDPALTLCKLQAVPTYNNMPAGVAAPTAAVLLVLAMLALVLFLRRPRARSTPASVAVPGEREPKSGLAGGVSTSADGQKRQQQLDQQLEHSQLDAASSKDAGGSGRDQDAGRKH